MLKRYFLNNKKRNFSTASIWIKGGSDMDRTGKKGLNKILCSLLTRGCEGFNNLTLSEYIESYGAELNQVIFEDGISISLKSLNEHFSKLFPLLDLIINKPLLTETEFKKVKKSSTDYLKKDKENPFNICFEKWRKIVYSNHPYAFNTIGNTNDVSKITYEDVLLEFKNFKNREKYLISNNPKINGENFGTLEKKIPKEKLITILGNKKDLIDSKNINSNKLKNTILMSIKNNNGERLLIDTIIKKCGLKQIENINIFLNERHLMNLSACLSNLNDTDAIVQNRLPFDLLSIELRDGIQNLSKITGQELTEELLDNIFSKFCIGK